MMSICITKLNGSNTLLQEGMGCLLNISGSGTLLILIVEELLLLKELDNEGPEAQKLLYGCSIEINIWKRCDKIY